jgi:hypothetical protein
MINQPAWGKPRVDPEPPKPAEYRAARSTLARTARFRRTSAANALGVAADALADHGKRPGDIEERLVARRIGAEGRGSPYSAGMPVPGGRLGSDTKIACTMQGVVGRLRCLDRSRGARSFRPKTPRRSTSAPATAVTVRRKSSAGPRIGPHFGSTRSGSSSGRAFEILSP